VHRTFPHNTAVNQHRWLTGHSEQLFTERSL